MPRTIRHFGTLLGSAARYDNCVRKPPLSVVAIVLAFGLAVLGALPFGAPSSARVSYLADGGCPEGSEPYGVLITKSGAAYLVCRDKEGDGLIYVPLAPEKEEVLDA